MKYRVSDLMALLPETCAGNEAQPGSAASADNIREAVMKKIEHEANQRPARRARYLAAGIAAAFACGRSDKNAHSISGRDVRAEMLRRGAQFADRPGLK